MSSRTPEECVELAADETAPEEERVAAVRELKTANECDELAALVRGDDMEEGLRRRTLEALATPQCTATLRGLIESEALPTGLREDAAHLYQELDVDEEMDTPGDVFEG